MVKKHIFLLLSLLPTISRGQFLSTTYIHDFVQAIQVFNNGDVWVDLCQDHTKRPFLLLGNISTPAGSVFYSQATKAWESNGTKGLYLEYANGNAPDPCANNYSARTPFQLQLIWN